MKKRGMGMRFATRALPLCCYWTPFNRPAGAWTDAARANPVKVMCIGTPIAADLPRRGLRTETDLNAESAEDAEGTLG
jgi:hypothetical protein